MLDMILEITLEDTVFHDCRTDLEEGFGLGKNEFFDVRFEFNRDIVSKMIREGDRDIFRLKNMDLTIAIGSVNASCSSVGSGRRIVVRIVLMIRMEDTVSVLKMKEIKEAPQTWRLLRLRIVSAITIIYY